MIRCACRKVIYDGLMLRIRVGQFAGGAMNLKCPQCRAWLNGLPIGLLAGEGDFDGRKTEGGLDG